jgi:hypothetical protein
MLQERVRVRDEPLLTLQLYPDNDQDMHRREILNVLERAAQDNYFIAQMTTDGDEALQSYHLNWQEKAALLSGDIRWIEMRLGSKLDARLRTWLDCRLEQEIW